MKFLLVLNHHVTDLELDSNNRLIVGTRTNTFNEGGGQVFYSDDGSTFTQFNLGALGSFDRTFVDVSPSDPNILYVMMENGNTILYNLYCEVFRCWKYMDSNKHCGR